MFYVPNILIVDDEPRMCDSLKVLLGDEGYEIQTRHNGQEALEALVKNDFDVVLLDLVLPDISGAEIMDHINSQAPETFVIVITGHASSDSAIDSLKKGAFDYFRKPYEHEQLLKTVKNALNHKALKSERKRVGEALRESEEKYKTLVNASITGIFIHQDGKYVFVNDRFAEMHDYTPEELLGKEYLTLIHPEERNEFAQIASARLKGKAVPQRYEVRRLRKDGTSIWCEMMATRIEYAGRPAVMGNIIDITERKRAEEELEQEKHEKEMILDSLVEHVVYQNLENKVLWANRAAYESVHKTREELVGQHCYEIWAGRQSTCEDCPVVKALNTGDPQAIEKTTPDGRSWYIQGYPVRGINRDIVGVVELTLDVTDRKRAEEERRKLGAQFQKAQKMESIGTLAGGIAHDFNNLLMGIQGNASLMLMDMDATHAYYERLKNIEKQVESGARLTSHLLGYARKGKYEVKAVDLNQLVEEASETFGRTRKQITIHREFADGLFAIEADSGQIEQVLLNLFVNAADAMPGGGDLFLKTMNVTHKDMTSKLYKPKRGDYVMLTVTDTGMGMDKETLDRVFDPFFTTKEMSHGTGLGLASVYGIIKGHGGYIEVESKKGEGTNFSIYLPASERKVEKAVKTAEQFIKGTGTVFLVDDEEVILEVGKHLLEAIGYRVLTARDGKEAIEIYTNNRDKIDLVILDMVMPRMGGGEAYDKMKEISPNIKVLLSSGYSIDGEATEILERGCDAFIQKPFKMKDLSQAIRKILGKK